MKLSYLVSTRRCFGESSASQYLRHRYSPISLAAFLPRIRSWSSRLILFSFAIFSADETDKDTWGTDFSNDEHFERVAGMIETLEPDIVNLLLERGEIVKLAEGVVFSTDAYNRMVEGVTGHLEAHGKVTLAEVRDLFQTSRKYAQALLEHLDARKLTRRVGDERVLY